MALPECRVGHKIKKVAVARDEVFGLGGYGQIQIRSSLESLSSVSIFDTSEIVIAFC